MATIPTDTLFTQQWHLRNTTVGEYDLNVIDVWDDYTGAGVDVGVLDSGFDRAHADFDNFDFNRDYDFIDNDFVADAGTGENHGTAVMGLIGAASDGTGAVGVAYGATLVGYRTDFGGTQIADAITRAVDTDNLDIVSMSFGFGSNVFVTGSSVDANLAALDHGVDTGRGGLGTIFVKSAGNSRAGNGSSDREETTAEAMDSDFRTITVAAVEADGDVTTYSSPGASVLVSAFGSPSPGTITTTDRTGSDGYSTGDHTSTFNGTSAAAPMVSGVVALMLEANSGLGWRDVQTILSISARHVGSDVGSVATVNEQASWGPGTSNSWGWNDANNWNGGGYHFSNDYGFGLVDALAAVRLAESWTQVSTSINQVSSFQDFLAGMVTIPDENLSGTTFTSMETSSVNIEHISLEVEFSTTFLADVEIYLTSPTGTISQLIADTGSGGNFTGRWLFGSNAFRGEDSAGTWSVQIIDDAGGDVLTVSDIILRTYGTSGTATDDHYYYTNEFSDFNGIGGHVATLNDTNGGTDTLNAAAVTSGSTVNLGGAGTTIDGVAITSISGIDNVYTGDGNDIVTGSSGANMISTGRGNDTLRGGGGADHLDGGAGDDYLFVDHLDTSIDGGAGYDRMFAEAGSLALNINLAASNLEYAQGGNWNDVFDATTVTEAVKLWGHGRDDTLTGSFFADYINGGAGNDTLNGWAGADILDGSTGADIFNGGAGDDIMFIDADDTTINGGADYDRVYVRGYSAGVDIDMTVGNLEFANGNTLDDTFNATGATWSVKLFGQGGNDTLTGGNLADQLYGSNGADIINGNGGNDIISGGTGADQLSGGAGNDIIFADIFDTLIDGGAGYDRLYVDPSSPGITIDLTAANIEFAYGGASSDFFYATGSTVAVKLQGRGGDDSLVGGNVADLLYGGSGSDDITGMGGNDFLSGGGADGAQDTFHFDFGWGDDTISDFENGLDIMDLINLSTNFASLTITALGANNTVVSFGGDSITLLGMQLGAVDAGDFVFV